MAEIAPVGSGGANRTFLLVVGGLAGLLVVGLLAVGAVFLLPTFLAPRAPVAAVTLVPTRVAIAPTATTVKPTAAPTAVMATSPALAAVVATNTAAPKPTELALTTGSGTQSTGSSQSTNAKQSSTGSLPQGGLGEDLLLLGGALALMIVALLARRARVAA